MNVLILALAATFSLPPESALRLVNLNETVVDATFCGESVRLAPGAITDLPVDELCHPLTLEASLPLVALELTASTQHQAVPDAECPTPAITVPAFGCPHGATVASVPYFDDAIYTWTVEGAAIVDGAGTNRVSLVLGEAAKAIVSVAIGTAACSSTATGVIAIRSPLLISELKASDSPQADRPVTLTWTYGEGGEPNSQTLFSELFEQPMVLPAAARSFTFTPESGGSKSIELRASYAYTLVAPMKKRRRAVAQTLEPAVICPATSSTLRLEIRGCGTTRPRINAPEEVEAGELFSATISVAEGERVVWSVENGAPVSTVDSSRITVRAGESGEVALSVRKEGVELCSSVASTRIPIYVGAAQCPVTLPTATVSLAAHDCEEVTVRASFTGKPPFVGVWTDGVDFRATTNSITRRFPSKPGTWGLTSFHDSACEGRIIGSASVSAFRPTVKLAATQKPCGGADLVATFTGTPPFQATWSDGLEINTTQSTIVRKDAPAGSWFVYGLSDAFCNNAYGLSERLEVKGKPDVYASDSVCLTSPTGESKVHASFTLPATPPFRVEWSDGVVSETPSGPHSVSRTVPHPGQWEKTYTIVRATTNGCDVDIKRSSTTVSYRPAPVIEISDHNPCIGATATARVTNALPPEAQYRWSIPGATVVSGRLTKQVAFTSDKSSISEARIEILYPDGSCESTAGADVWFSDVFPSIDLRAFPTTIKRGGTASITWKHSGSYSGPELPGERNGDFVLERCTRDLCQAKFYDTVGPGQVPLTIGWGDCMGRHEETVTITIEP